MEEKEPVFSKDVCQDTNTNSMFTRLRVQLLFVAVALALLTLFAPHNAIPQALAQEQHHADIVVDLGDGTIEVERVTFTEDSISGLDALKATSLNVVESNGTICSINGIGCPADDCFCGCPPPFEPCIFWNYHHQEDGAWQFSQVGAGDYVVTDGAGEGWSWGGTPPVLTAQMLATEATLDWLRTQQGDDGSFPTLFGDPTGPTLDILLSFAAANVDSADWPSKNGNTMLDYIESHGVDYANSGPSAAGKLVLGVVAGGLDPHSFNGTDLIGIINGNYDEATGAYGTNTWDQAYSMLALKAAGETIPAAAVNTLIDRADATNGYWTYGPDSDFSYVDTTGLVLQALIAAGQSPDSDVIKNAVAYLGTVQTDDGGFPNLPPFAGPEPDYGNANTTLMAMQGLIAAGENIQGADWTKGSNNPTSFLLSLQQPDGGIATDPTSTESNLFATQQVIPAMVGKPFPLANADMALQDGITWLQDQQQSDGSFGDVDSTIDAIFALAANGVDPKDVTQGGNSPLDYLIANANDYVETNNSAEAAGKLLLGALVGIGDSGNFDVSGAVATVEEYYEITTITGAYGNGSTADQVWAMLGLSAPGEAIPEDATEYLKDLQLDSGGWGETADASTADIQNTALALQALSVVGVIKDDPVVQQGIAYLRGAQNADGGWGAQSSDATTAAATGQALQALASYNEAPTSLAWTTTDYHTPMDALAALQNAEGSFDDTLASTTDALIGMQGKDLLFVPFNFTASTFGGKAPVDVAFDSMHSDAWSTYDWDFGDGTTSTDASPSHTYDEAGMYTVTLTMDDAEGTPTTFIRANFISVLKPDFAIDGYSNTMPMTVTFINTSEGVYEDVVWDFGDGQQSADENPTHAYAEPGVYTVTLTIGGVGGSETEQKSSFVHIYEPLEVNFTAAPVCNFNTPLTMQFNNTSSGDSYSDVYGKDPDEPQNVWHFGDDNSSDESNPLHTYKATGTYTVSLTVQNAYGAFLTKDERIEVTPPRTDVSGSSHWQAVVNALAWLQSLQSEDGSYADVGYTLDTLLAAAAANQDIAAWQSTRGNSMLDYLRGEAADYADDSAARAGKLVLAIAAAGQDPRDFGGNDLVDILTSNYDEATGAYGSNNWDQAFCILGLKAAGEAVPSEAVELLASRATQEGYWAYGPESTFSYVDTTGLVLQALIAGGQAPDSAVIQKAIAYLHSVQTEDGGFADRPAWPGEDAPDYANANTTALSVQGLLAVGEDPLSASWTISNTNPIDFLYSLQQSDGGLLWIADSANSNLLATQQAIPAMVGKPFPYASTSVATRKGIEWIASQQQDDGSFAGGWSGNEGTTIDAMLAIAAAGKNPQDFTSSSGNGALDYLADHAQDYASQSAAAAGKLLFGLVNAGASRAPFGDTNLVISMTNYYSPTTGMFGAGSTWDQAWSIIGVMAASNALSETMPITIPQQAVTYLKDLQVDDGGWGFGSSGSVDGTGLALQALAAAGVSKDDTAVSAGIDYLWATQNADGGWGDACGSGTSASSTALAIQGLLAYDEDPRSAKWTMSASDGSPSQATLHTPYDALLELQSQEGGFAGWNGDNDPMASYQSVPAIAQRTFPLQAQQAVATQAGFDATPVEGTAPLTVTFTNTSSGDYTESLWDFGDGETSTLFNPTHVYAEPGTYTVQLTMKGPGGEDNFTMDIEVTEGQGTPEPTELVANFTVTPTSGTVPLTVTFTNTSTPDNYTSNLWDFGDGKTSTLTSTEHIYTQAGTYTVTLTVTWPTGTDTISKTSLIAVQGTIPSSEDTYVYLPIIMRTTQ